MKVVETSAETVDKAIELALQELNVSRESIEYEVLEESKKTFFGMFGKNLVKVRVKIIQAPEEKLEVLKVNIEENQEFEEVLEANETKSFVRNEREYLPPSNEVLECAEIKAKIFLQKIFDTMQLKVIMEKMVNKDRVININIHGDDVSILIGRHGQTLDSLQYLTNLIVNRGLEQRVKVVVDVEKYRKRRNDTLTTLALRIAAKVKRTKEKEVLAPMNPHERKIVHMALQNDFKISTYSEGDEPYRKIVVCPKR